MHGRNNIAIRIIKLYGKSTALPLRFIFQCILNDGVFPDECKKNHKKDSQNLIKNYRPTSLLPSFSKVFERLTCNSLYNYFTYKQTFFWLPVRCYARWFMCLLITFNYSRNLQKFFDYKLLVNKKRVFLDLTETLDKVWHDGLIPKLYTHAIDGKL